MHSILTDLHPPTTIDHAVKCNFFNDLEVNLVLASSSILNVYRLYEEKIKDEDDVPYSSNVTADKKKRLEKVASYTLYGNVINIEAVRLGNNSRDSIILSFRDAKLSIVEYDPLTHDLKTDSMHFFENSKLELTNGVVQNIYDPLVRVDPENRCACMLVYGYHLVVLPFGPKYKKNHESKSEYDNSEERKVVLPSYMIDLRALDTPILNVADLTFLHGYQEPTIMILFEPVQTSSGRVAVRQDTFCVAAISLNMVEKVHPIIWTVNNLPFDCQRICAIEKPLGGVLVFACNSLIYLNQSTPPYGVSLNCMTEGSTSFPLENQPGTVITLAEVSFDSIGQNKIVLSLKGGEIYVLTLITDGLRNIQSFHFDKAAGSVLASCVCSIEDDYIFIGSRLGNSLLLRYKEKTREADIQLQKKIGEQPSKKKRKKEENADVEDLELFGSSNNTITSQFIVTYVFEVADSIMNIGPITKCAIGEPAFLSEEFSGSVQNNLELICCSGYGKNGSLTVLQRSLKPQVVTTFELPGCLDMWTVYSRSFEDSNTTANNHSHLILSREDSTMVLKTADEITEVDNSGFAVQAPTIYACNLGNKQYIVQFCPMNIHLLEGILKINEIELDPAGPSIIDVSSHDPHSVLLMSDGTVRYLELVKDFDKPSMKLTEPKKWGDKITNIFVYKDESGLFNLSNNIELGGASRRFQRISSVLPMVNTEFNLHERKRSLTIQEEEDLLYGNSISTSLNIENQSTAASNQSNESKSPKQTTCSYWCFVTTETCCLEIYSLPGFKSAFCCQNFSNAPKLLLDHERSQNSGVRFGDKDRVKEILMLDVKAKTNPFLFALMDQDIVVYECFPVSKQNTGVNRLPVRFKRLEMNVLMRVKEESKLAEMADKKSRKTEFKIHQMKAFQKVGTYEKGVFVCGPYPHWIFITPHGHVTTHPMVLDGPIVSFATFNNVNCPNGFLYFNKQGELRICVLPGHLTYNSPWPVRKIPLRMTPYHIAYEPDSKVYAVACAYYEYQKKVPRFHSEEREFDSIEREPRYIYPQIERFVIQLISPTAWEVIPNSRTVLQEFEHVTCMKVVGLQSDFLGTGLKNFVVVGTSYNFGEDLACKGRILIFDIIEVVPEPGKPLTKTKSKCLYDKEQKGPITAISASSGYLIAAQGQKIYAYSFKSNNLIGVAFVDAQVYTVSLITIRNLIVAADISRSVSLIRFQVNHKSLALVSRDSNHLESTCVEFLIDGSQIGFLVSDIENNIMLFKYEPEALESFGGQRLLQIADINTGAPVHTMFRIRVPQEELYFNKQDQRQVLFMPTLDGSILSVLPLAEKPFRRLMMLQNKLVDCMQHRAGLNPRAYRALKTPIRKLTNPRKNILDGQLLQSYIHMCFQERFDIARKMGTTPSQILDDLMEVRRACSQF